MDLSARRLLSLLVVAVLASVVVNLAPTAAAAACAGPSSKQIAGTVKGEDGRFVSSLVGIELLDGHARKIRMDGCLMSEAGYSVTAHTNLKSSCCYLLSGTGSTGPTYDGQTLSHSWKVTGLPSNAVTVWIEVYPKRCCTPAGTSNTDDSRYGRALRRPIPLPATGVDVRLPLRCGLSGGGVSGRTGSIVGKVFDNGKVVGSSRVGAWSQEPDTEAKILGWGLDVGAGSFDVDALAPGRYSIIANANGLSRHIYNIDVAACQATNVDVAVRGSVPAAGVVTGDWDGDGDEEPGTFRGGTWRLRGGVGINDAVVQTFTYGVQAGDVPVVGDWDGDGVDDAGIFRAGGAWHLRSSATGQTVETVTYGRSAGDRPVVGDWNGDGVDDLGIFRAGGSWHLRRSSTGTTMPLITYGQSAGDAPVVGDWDGDGDDEPGIYRRGGAWHLLASTNPSAGTFRTVTYGVSAGDRPVTGAWTGGAATSIGIFRSGTWHLRSSTTASGSTLVTFPFSG